MQDVIEGGKLCLQFETTANENEPFYVRVLRKKYKLTPHYFSTLKRLQ